ncbi:hypothetical protein HK099_007473 [Clydaea vesicula]|uniref:Velvet domain-containing protein n=1 Tax=Clydaea vesicula TaxID=447962 RepID=A0AAD5TYL4_9FUNG|nr:hypothetical protein HK099_007473 [Clydaea vesicula]
MITNFNITGLLSPKQRSNLTNDKNIPKNINDNNSIFTYDSNNDNFNESLNTSKVSEPPDNQNNFKKIKLDYTNPTTVDESTLLKSSARTMNRRAYTGSKNYGLVMRQQPYHARMCGNTNKDRRSVDPPPIVELFEIDEEGQLYPVIKESGYYSMRCDLWDEDGLSKAKAVKKNGNQLPLILGDLMEGSRILTDDLGRVGTFFVFNDISIRYQGKYKLKFTFYDLENPDKPASLANKTSIRAEIFSNTFVAITAREFPGMLKSAQITKIFKTQGLKLSIRN